MVGIEDCGGPNESYEYVLRRRTHDIYATQTMERKNFMDDLKLFRARKTKKLLKMLIVEPNWYQVLSEYQRTSLNRLERCIHEDLIEGRPVRTKRLLISIGICELPKNDVLMTCIFLGKQDPKVLLAQLFLYTYNHSFDHKREKYDLNAKLILSSILHLGLDHIIAMLHERLRPPVTTIDVMEEQEEKECYTPSPKPRKKIMSKKSSTIISPYLQKPSPAIMYSVRPKKKIKPLPLPAIEDLELDQEFEEETHDEPIDVSPPKTRGVGQNEGLVHNEGLGHNEASGHNEKTLASIGRRRRPGKIKVSPSICDELAGIHRIQVYKSAEAIIPTRQEKKKRATKVGAVSPKTKKSKKKPPETKSLTPLKTDRWNKQYHINGVAIIRGQHVYVLAGLVELPLMGHMIMGGGVRIKSGEVVSQIEGICLSKSPTSTHQEKCNCMEKWNDAVFRYIGSHKCTCGHFYDFDNEGTFPENITPFFVKPTGFTPYYFNYDHIFDLDEKRLLVTNEFDHFYRSDSMLNQEVKKKKKKKKKQRKKKTGEKVVSGYLEYLRVALLTVRKYDLAAKLPELYLVPELRAWMRMRVRGPLTRRDKKILKNKSDVLSKLFHKIYTLTFYGHIQTNPRGKYLLPTTWRYAPGVKKHFNKYIESYRKQVYKVQMDLVNRFWGTMIQADWPDNSFRRVFFSYCVSSIKDVLLINPYDPAASVERRIIFSSSTRAYRCPIKGD